MAKKKAKAKKPKKKKKKKKKPTQAPAIPTFKSRSATAVTLSFSDEGLTEVEDVALAWLAAKLSQEGAQADYDRLPWNNELSGKGWESARDLVNKTRIEEQEALLHLLDTITSEGRVQRLARTC